MTVRVAFQGELGAYSEEAVHRHWMDAALDGAVVEPVPARSCADVVRLVEDARVGYGLLPIENSLAGSINATYDALAASRALHLVGETVLPIHHCMLAPRGATLETVRTVESHPVALAQCGRFLERHPHLLVRAAYDTAGAAQEIAWQGDRTRSAVAGRIAAERFGLTILAADIEDRADNQTRFLALARHCVGVDPGAAAKTALIVATPNVAGALHRLLAPFAEAGVNLSKLESHASGEPWTYQFFLELEHRLDRAQLDALLLDVANVSVSVRELGTFVPHRSPAPPVTSETPFPWASVASRPAPPSPPEVRPPRELRAVRGATTVGRDAANEILDATRELLREVMRRNGFGADDVISAIFTTTPDLTSAYPAAAARDLGWAGVPLMCMSEIAVPTGLPHCVRVLIHAEMERDVQRPRHVYLRDAAVLRPDLENRD